MSGWTIAIMLALYVGAVLVVGALASRNAARSPDEYFLAGRSLGTFVLFMALFGTNCTAFVLVGIPGRAYHDGIGTLSVNAPLVALGVPLTFWAIGSPARRMAARLGALTPAELYARRFGSKTLGVVLFAVFTAYTLPYMVTAVKGAAVTLYVVSDQAVPRWLGGLGVVAVALAYTALGGMRATAWTNVLQGIIFLSFVLVAIAVMADSLGGVKAAMTAVYERDKDLLRMGDHGLFAPRAFASWSIVMAVTVIGFPHMLVRLMAGKDERALQGASKLYPLAIMFLWVPVVLIGVWGATSFPGLAGPASDRIFSLMAARHLPPILAALGFLAVLAAVMSTLDAQILTLGSMLTRDVLAPLRRAGTDANAQREVRYGRVFGVGIAALVYAMAQLVGNSIFDIARFAFSGYVTLVPTLLLSVRWRRFTVAGALASIAAGNLLLLAGEFWNMPTAGFLPVFFALIAALVAGVGVSLVTAPADRDLTRRAFG